MQELLRLRWCFFKGLSPGSQPGHGHARSSGGHAEHATPHTGSIAHLGALGLQPPAGNVCQPHVCMLLQAPSLRLWEAI